MMSYHRSFLAFVAIKHTDRVRTVNMLTLGMGKAAIAELGCTALPLFPVIHLKVYFFRATGYFY